MRSPKGRIARFDPPNSTDTEALGINAKGVITGHFSHGAGKYTHGFLLTP